MTHPNHRILIGAASTRLKAAGMRPKRRLILAAVFVAGVLFVSVAAAKTVYAPYRHFAPGADAQSGFDQGFAAGVYHYWWTNEMIYKTSWGRVAFIDPGGSWHCSMSDTNYRTYCTYTDLYQYKKLAYCKNNGIYDYNAECDAEMT